MKSLSIILKRLKNQVPYFIVILVYFFFVNLEAKKQKESNNSIEKKEKLTKKNLSVDEGQIRIKIPVIPYKK
tara:strand:+ start:125 stop:340 length:216 start_codon:yes stop_codon:yes gene_type:complete